MADSDTETHSGDELHKATYGKANLALIGKDTSGLSKYAIGIPAEIDQVINILSLPFDLSLCSGEIGSCSGQG